MFRNVESADEGVNMSELQAHHCIHGRNFAVKYGGQFGVKPI